MKIRFHCENCNRRIKVFANKVGKKIICPTCHAKFAVPPIDSPKIIGVECYCGEKFSPEEKQCPTCGTPIVAPPSFAFSPDEPAAEVTGSPSEFPHPVPVAQGQLSPFIRTLWAICMFITVISSSYIIYNIVARGFDEVFGFQDRVEQTLPPEND